MENKISKFIKEFFENNDFNIFYIDKEDLVIRVNSECLIDNSHHESMFGELQKITAMLDFMDIDYSVDMDASIILH